MTSTAFFLLLLNMTLDTTGQLAFKAAANRSAAFDGWSHWRHMAGRPWLWLGIFCYVAEFVCWMAFLSLVPLSSGVMIASINTVVIMIAGRILFQERLTNWRLAGMILISAGVAVVGLGG